jgi:hypothetical protein
MLAKQWHKLLLMPKSKLAEQLVSICYFTNIKSNRYFLDDLKTGASNAAESIKEKANDAAEASSKALSDASSAASETYGIPSLIDKNMQDIL